MTFPFCIPFFLFTIPFSPFPLSASFVSTHLLSAFFLPSLAPKGAFSFDRQSACEIFEMYNFPQYNDDFSSSQPVQGGEESGTRTPTERDEGLRPATLASSLQASHLLASGFDTSSPASSSSSSTPSNYTIDSLASARNYLIENQEQLYNASTARRTSLPNTQRPHSSLSNSSDPLKSSNYIRSLLYQSSHRASNMYQDRSSHSSQSHLRGVQPPQGGFQCPNCSKIFARGEQVFEASGRG